MYSRGKTIAKLVNSIDQFSCQTKVGDILITAGRDAYNGQTFAQNLKAMKRTLHKTFAKGVSVVTRSDAGRLHCHVAVELAESCKDYDWTSFNEAERYYLLYKTFRGKEDLRFFRYYTKKYRASLPKSWKEINHKLMALGKKHGLGRVFLTPVKKNMQALKWYYVSNIPYTRDDRDRHIQYFTAWGMSKIVGFQVVNKYTKDYRSKLRRFAEGLQLNSENYNISLRSVLGRRWYFNCKDLIRDIEKLSHSQVTQYHEIREAVQTHQLRSS